MITIAPELVERSLDELRRCGGGRRECVVYWLAAQTHPAEALEIVHPVHLAGSGWYEVDSAWLTQFSLELADRHLTAVAQVHTHPGQYVTHSDIDDEFVLVPSPGFVSVVLPEHARDHDVTSWGVFVLEPAGTWRLDRRAVTW